MNDAHIRNGKTTSSSDSVHSTSTSHSIKPASFTNSANISSASSFASPQMGAPALSPPSSGLTNSSPSVHDNNTNTDASVTVAENTSSTSGLGLGLGLTSDTMTASSISSQNMSIAANNRSSNASPSCSGPATGSPSSQSDLFAGSVPAFDNAHGHDGRAVRIPPYGATNPIGSTPTTVSRPPRSALSEIIADSVRIPSSSTNNTTNAVTKPIGLGLSGTGLGPGFDPAPQRPVTVVVRRLPVGTDSDSAKLMMLFLGENLVDIETAPDAEEPEFVSATVTVRSRAAADQVLRNLNNKMNSRATAHMVVEIASGSSSPTQGSGQMRGISPTGSRSLLQSSVPYSAAPSSNIQQQQQHSVSGSNGSGTVGVNANQDMAATDNLSDSIMTYLWFNNVDPVGPGHIGPVQRRATLAHISPQQTANLSSAMGNLSLNTNFPTGHLGNYGGPASAISPMLGRNQASPMTAGGISVHPMNFGNQTPQGPQYRRNSNYPSANPADQNPPCNTLYVGNLPQGTTEEELKSAFSGCKGYKRLCYRVKSNGPMCFVEFEDVPAATKCLKDMYGFLLPRSNKHGIRLSFSKNPLGVRSNNTTASPNSLSNALGQHQSPFTSATGPPPGLSAPPGLNLNVNAAAAAVAASRNGSTTNGMYPVGGETTPASATLPQSATGFYSGSATANPWNTNMFSPQAPIGTGSPASSMNNGFGNGFFMHMSPGQQQSQQQQSGQSMFPPHMMGR